MILRSTRFIRTRLAPAPDALPDSDLVLYAHNDASAGSRPGLSGSPVVLLRADSPPALLGVYLGVATHTVLGVPYRAPLAIHRRYLSDVGCYFCA